jgi:hypothetical protein
MNLVLGTAVNYGINEISVFVKSFRKFNQTDKIILIFDDISNKPDLINFLFDWNVDFFKYDGKFGTSAIDVAHSRFTLYKEILESNKEINSVLITDVRDVVFQSDFFKDIKSEEFIYFFEEDTNSDIKSEFTHTDWIKDYWGSDNYSRLENCQILCSGTTFGSINQIIIYLNNLNKYISESLIYGFLSDHTHHNWIGHFEKDKFENLEHKINGDIIATIGLTLERSNHLIKIKSGKLYLGDRLPSLIHQYDRSKELVSFFNQKYL